MSERLPERKPAPERSVYTFDDFGNLGMLWLINRAVFHPRGFALALDYADGESEPRGWSVHAAATGEPFSFGLPDGMEEERFRSVEEILAVAREYGAAPAPLAPEVQP
jgi:hypothetical protein